MVVITLASPLSKRKIISVLSHYRLMYNYCKGLFFSICPEIRSKLNGATERGFNLNKINDHNSLLVNIVSDASLVFRIVGMSKVLFFNLP